MSPLFSGIYLRLAQTILLLRGVCKGESTASIAREIGVSCQTVHFYRQEIQTNAKLLQPIDPLQDKYTETDEIFHNAGEKGTLHPDPDDPPRRRGNKTFTQTDAEVYTDEWQGYNHVIRSHATEGGQLLKNISPVFITVDNPLITLPNVTIFTSATGEQVSTWYPEVKHSLFTYFFLKGLQGAADANDDKKVTVSELEQFITDQTEGVPYYARRLHNREQTPVVSGDKNRVIVHFTGLIINS